MQELVTIWVHEHTCVHKWSYLVQYVLGKQIFIFFFTTFQWM